MIDYFPGFSGLSGRALRHARRAEHDAFERADLLALPTAWAVDSAVHAHGVSPRKILQLPFGPSFDISRDEASTILENREPEPWRLLWIGSEWARKGGAIAMNAAARLASRGRRVELAMAGSIPDSASVPACVRVLGVIPRGEASGREQLSRLYRQSHAILMPTRADCAPIALRDAMAHAMPMIASRTGGIPSMIDDGVEGRLLEPDASADDWADAIDACLGDPATRRAMSQASRRRHEREWNWRDSVGRLEAGIRSCRRDAEPGTAEDPWEKKRPRSFESTAPPAGAPSRSSPES